MTVLYREPPARLQDASKWRQVGVRKWALNVPDGPSATLYDTGAITVERSLPKALWGQNIDELGAIDASVALATLDAELAVMFRDADLPSVAEAAPVKVAYTDNLDLGDEDLVLRTLKGYADIELPRKGLPVVGQSHSVSWSRGGVRCKAYSKYDETGRDRRAMGVLRREYDVVRGRTFRRLLGLDQEADLRLLDVLTPALRREVVGTFAGHLNGGSLTMRELSDVRLFNEMVAYFGAAKTMHLLGWCLAFAMKGCRSRQDMIAVGILSLESRYRVLRALRDFRAHLIAEGYEVGAEGDEPEVAVMWRLRALADAA